MYSYITVPVITVFADVDLKKNPKGYLYLANRISKIAKEYLNKFVFVVANKKDEKDSIKDHGLPSLSGETLIPEYGIFNHVSVCDSPPHTHIASLILSSSISVCLSLSLSRPHAHTCTHTCSRLHSSLPLSPLFTSLSHRQERHRVRIEVR